MTFKFQHINAFIITDDNGRSALISIPPGKNRIDLMDSNRMHIDTGYLYRFKGILIISDSKKRYIIDEDGEIKAMIYYEN